MGGAGGAATTSSSAGGGAQPADGTVCGDCLGKCAQQIQDCEEVPNCNQNYRPCMVEPGLCCKASGGAWGGPEAQTLYACIQAMCELECNLNPHCGDCLKNSAETDVDCGGDACSPCETGEQCAADGDCESSTCSADGTCM